MSKWDMDFWKAIGERVGMTAIEVLIPMIVAAEVITALNWGHTAAIVGTASLLAFLKGLLANLKKTSSGPGLSRAEELRTRL